MRACANLGFGFDDNDYDFARFSGGGIMGGGQVGLRYAILNTGWVVGGEFGGLAGQLKGRDAEGPFAQMNWQLWQVAQIGFSTQMFGTPVLISAGGGVTEGRFKAGVEFFNSRDEMRDTLVGALARGSLDIQVLPNVSLGILYQFSHFSGRVQEEPLKTDVHMALFTLNYNFSSPGR